MGSLFLRKTKQQKIHHPRSIPASLAYATPVSSPPPVIAVIPLLDRHPDPPPTERTDHEKDALQRIEKVYAT